MSDYDPLFAMASKMGDMGQHLQQVETVEPPYIVFPSVSGLTIPVAPFNAFPDLTIRANSLGPNGFIYGRYNAIVQNASGGSRAITFDTSFGASALSSTSGAFTGSDPRWVMVQFWVYNQGTPSTTYMLTRIAWSNAAAVGAQTNFAFDQVEWTNAISVDTTVDQLLIATLTPSGTGFNLWIFQPVIEVRFVN